MKTAIIIITLLVAIILVIFEIWNRTIDSKFVGKLIVIVVSIIVIACILPLP